MKRPTRFVSRGAVAGILGATAIALWFLVIDAVRGQILYTPAFLAAAIFGLESPDQVGPGLILGYTLLHYAVFVGLGIAIAWLLGRLDTAPNFLLGVVAGFLLFDLTFYIGVIVRGANVVNELGWPEVLIGNLFAGVVLMAYLHFTSPTPGVTWWEVLKRHRIYREGMVAGLIGASVVALWFLIFDLLVRRIFFTPAAVGSALFYGARSAAEVQITAATVVGYTFIHVAAFLLIGIVAAAVLNEAEEEPPLILGLVLLFVTFETLFIGLVAIFADWILDNIAWWSILVGNLLAAMAMGVFLWREHPRLRMQLREHGMELEEPAYRG